MPRPEKVQAVADIKERLDGAQAVFLAEYAGLSVQEQQTLRRELRANGAEFKVVKMTLARLAAADMEIEDFDALLLGPTGLTFADGDPVAAAKVLRDFAKSHEVLVVKGGLLGREFLTPERIADLAEIEQMIDELDRDLHPHQIMLMPEGITPEQTHARHSQLVGICKEKGYRLCPRLHLDLFGNVRGT